MNQIKEVEIKFDIYKKIENISDYYRFFDFIAHKFTGNNEITIRQITSKNDLVSLSTARKRMYGQRDEYFKSFYSSDTYLDQYDARSYIFACFYRGEIIGTQRATCYPFEASNHLEDLKLNEFLGLNYKDEYIEFSRLLVDKNTRISNLANVLGFITGSLIALSSDYEKYITYSKPKIKRKSLSFSEETLQFNITSRNNDIYELYKGSIIKDIQNIFSIKGNNSDEILKNFNEFIFKNAKSLTEA